VQGFFYSEPVTPEAHAELLARHRPKGGK
jgi:hypothetical protein